MFARYKNFNQFKYDEQQTNSYTYSCSMHLLHVPDWFVPSIKRILTIVEHSLCNSCLFTYFLWSNDVYIYIHISTGRINKMVGCWQTRNLCFASRATQFPTVFFLFTRPHWALILSYDWLNESMFQEYDDDGRAQAIEPDATARYILSQNPGSDKC